MELLIKKKWKLLNASKLGTGAFGEVFQGVNLETSQQVSIKLESKDNKFKQLLKEAKFYLKLQPKDKESYEGKNL